ncbi:MAG: thermonuclease family protein [Candidatus Bipolaricaulaceae bacterium]
MKRASLLFFLTIALGALALSQPPEGAFPARITRWVDGDTAQIRILGGAPSFVGKYETVRLLGINAPEVGEPFADEATNYFRTLTMGKTVYVELSLVERRDVHDRLLAYLWVETQDGWVLVNEALLRRGLARLLVFYPELEKYYCRFLRALTLAQLDKLGIWSAFPAPLGLGSLEADPVRYVLTVVSVVFRVSRVGQDQYGWSLWAEGSRYGFRAILSPTVCQGGWQDWPWDPAQLVGKEIVVTGELQWDSLKGGPRIVVFFPEQCEILEGER